MKKINVKVFAIFGVFLLFLYVQHKFVFMHFDDFGYASLTYACGGRADYLQGRLQDILSYLNHHYFNWGGRVLYYFLLIVALRSGLWFIQLFQTLIIFGIGVMSYQLVRLVKEKADSWVIASLVCLFYGLFSITTVRETMYWYAAASSYIWPLLPFFAAILLQEKVVKGNGTKKDIVCSSILFFLGAFSQEQVAVLVMVHTIVYGALYYVENRSLYKGAVSHLLASIAGGALLLCAPGNFARSAADANEVFNELSFFGKIGYNLPELLDINLGKGNVLFVLVLIFSAVWLSVRVKWNGKFAEVVRKCNIMLTILLSVGVILGWHDLYETWITNMVSVGWIILYCVNVSKYFWDARKIFVLALFWGGICSQGMMVISPTLTPRCIVMFQFGMNIILTVMILEFLENCVKKWRVVFLGLFGIMSLYNALSIASGYYGNYKINQINHYKLLEKSERIAAGMECEEIVLYRLQDDRYASMMPYQHTFIQNWMKYYYKIPQEVTIIYERLERPGYIQEVTVSIPPEIVGFYLERKNGETVRNEDGSISLAVTPDIVTDNLQVIVNDVEYSTAIGVDFISVVIPKDAVTDELDVCVRDKSTGLCSEIEVVIP